MRSWMVFLHGVGVIRDDILVMGYGENEDEANRNYDENLTRLLEQARKANLCLNSNKMNLRKTSVNTGAKSHSLT